MSIAALVLVVVLCFVAGYAIVNAIMRAFMRPPPDPLDRRYRAVLGVSPRASEFEIQAAYRRLTARYPAPASADGAGASAKEIDEAYDYFKRRYGFQ